MAAGKKVRQQGKRCGGGNLSRNMFPLQQLFGPFHHKCSRDVNKQRNWLEKRSASCSVRLQGAVARERERDTETAALPWVFVFKCANHQRPAENLCSGIVCSPVLLKQIMNFEGQKFVNFHLTKILLKIRQYIFIYGLVLWGVWGSHSICVKALMAAGTQTHSAGYHQMEFVTSFHFLREQRFHTNSQCSRMCKGRLNTNAPSSVSMTTVIPVW